MVLLGITFIGLYFFGLYFCILESKRKKFVRKVAGEFTAKYGKLRGFDMLVNDMGSIEITVDNPGTLLPNVPLFTISKENLKRVQASWDTILPTSDIQLNTVVAPASMPVSAAPYPL